MTAPHDTPVPDSPRPSRVWVAGSFLLVLLVCAGVYWPGLGATGLSMSEGHRVLPAWEMLDHGDYLVPRLFGQAYLRKPPGMPWAVALSSAVLGRTEFAARAVSAASMTVMAAVAFAFAARWYGPRWAAAGGLATALAPLIWNSGRSAEIEALNNFATHAAILLAIDMLVCRRGRGVARPVLLAVALTGVGLAKGPASLPCLVATLCAACVVTRSRGPLVSAQIWTAALVSGAVLALVAWRIARAADGESLVTQARSDFLWNPEHHTLRGVLGVLKLGPESLLLTFPATAAMMFPWGPDARAEADHSDDARRAFDAARAVTLTSLIALALYTALGVDNPRYALPACVIVPMVVPYVLRGMSIEFSRLRKLIARILLFGSPWVALGLSIGGAVFFQLWHDRERQALSGRDAGIALGRSIPDGAEIWSDGLVDARPDVPHYARLEAERLGRTVTIRWTPRGTDVLPLPPPGGYLLLRRDAGLDELAQLQAEHPDARLSLITEGGVYKFRFVLARVEP